MLRVLFYDDKTLIAVENEKENLGKRKLRFKSIKSRIKRCCQ